MPEPDSKADTEADTDTDEARLLDVARRYYLSDQSKVAIATDLGLSRFRVARLLTEARRAGLVRIEVGSPGRVDRDMSAALRERLHIDRAVVVGSAGPGYSRSTVDHVGAALGDQLARVVRAGDTVGVAWSEATVAMSARLPSLAECSVVQLAGVVYPPAGVPGSVEVAGRVARAAGGQAHVLYSPLVVPDEQTAAGLRRQPEIAATLRSARSLDVAVLSVGAWQPSASAVFDLLTPDEQEELTRAGVVGEVSGRLLDGEGRWLTTFLEDRVVGVEAEVLADVPTLVVSSHGAYRAAATRAVVQAGLVHTLVVDDQLADALLA